MTRHLKIIAPLVLVVLLGAAWYWHVMLVRGLPPRIECRDEADALAQAAAYIVDRGGTIVPVLGTGSMQPYIPAAPAGADPLNTVCAFVITQASASIWDISPGALVVYWADWLPGRSVLHQAAKFDGSGWIMTGLANREYENRWRVTDRNFIGIAARTFVWPQNFNDRKNPDKRTADRG